MAKAKKPAYPASHERDEGRKMKKSLIRSILGILFIWVPLIGAALGLSGFLRACSRVTRKYRVALVLLIAFSLIVLAADIGVLTWEVYAYTRSPEIVTMTGDCVWKLLTDAPDRDAALKNTAEAWKHPEKLVNGAKPADDDYSYTPEGVDYDTAGGYGLGQEEEIPGVLLIGDMLTGDTAPQQDGNESADPVIPGGVPSVQDILNGEKRGGSADDLLGNK